MSIENNFLRVKDLRTQLSEMPDDAIVVVYDNEYGAYYAALQVKLIGGRVLIWEYDEFNNMGPKVEVNEEVAHANS